ncbi:MAG: leucyl/phenylalanyl-tRNA--protein transferase [Acidimicrobiales bacterium]
MPIETPPCRWALPSPATRDPDGICGIGADLEPGTVLAAYRRGLFPMHLDRRARHLAWWSPDPRGIVPLDGVRVSRSLRRALTRFEIRVDTAFVDVIRACSEPRPTGGHWIHPAIVGAYTRLHELGWAHSVESWDLHTGTLAGGLYGIAIGGLFAGESMFHRRTDASKVAFVGLVERLQDGTEPEHRLLDVQWATPHLASLGAVEISREDYLERLRPAIELPLPPAFA